MTDVDALLEEAFKEAQNVQTDAPSNGATGPTVAEAAKHAAKVDQTESSRRDSRDGDKRSYSRKRSRSRSRSRSGSPRRSRSRHDRDRDRGRRGGGRSYHDRDRYHRGGRDRDRYHDRHYDRHDRRGSGERERRRSRSPRKSKEERLLEEAERQSRTGFIQGLLKKIGGKDLKEWYAERDVKVKAVQLIKDKYSGKSKGFGYIEFASIEELTKALRCNGQLLGICPITLAPSQAEKNFAGSAIAAAVPSLAEPVKEALSGPPEARVYVGSLHYSITEPDLQALFAPLGDLLTVTLHRDSSTNSSKGFAFLQYRTVEAAMRALTLNGVLLAGRNIKVGLPKSGPQGAPVDNAIIANAAALAGVQVPGLPGVPQVPGVPAPVPGVGGQGGILPVPGTAPAAAAAAAAAVPAVASTAPAAAPAAAAGTAPGVAPAVPGAQGGVVPAAVAAIAASLSAKVPEPVERIRAGELDDNGGGMKLTAESRAALMARLGGGTGATMIKQAPAMPQISIPGFEGARVVPPTASPIPTPCLALRNMFNPATETDPNFDLDIREEISEELAKFGTVQGIVVDKTSPLGLVWVKMADVSAAIAARSAINGRFFGGQTVMVDFIEPSLYDTV